MWLKVIWEYGIHIVTTRVKSVSVSPGPTVLRATVVHAQSVPTAFLLCTWVLIPSLLLWTLYYAELLTRSLTSQRLPIGKVTSQSPLDPVVSEHWVLLGMRKDRQQVDNRTGLFLSGSYLSYLGCRLLIWCFDLAKSNSLLPMSKAVLIVCYCTFNGDNSVSLVAWIPCGFEVGQEQTWWRIEVSWFFFCHRRDLGRNKLPFLSYKWQICKRPQLCPCGLCLY